MAENSENNASGKEFAANIRVAAASAPTGFVVKQKATQGREKEIEKRGTKDAKTFAKVRPYWNSTKAGRLIGGVSKAAGSPR